MAKNEDNWLSNYEAVKAHVAETGHFPDKDPFEIINKKIDTTGKEMLFTVMEFMNQKIDRTDFLAKMGSLSEKVDGIRAEEKELRTTFDRIIAQIEKLQQ